MFGNNKERIENLEADLLTVEAEVRELGKELLKFKLRVVDLEKALKNKEPNFDRRKTARTDKQRKSSGKRGI